MATAREIRRRIRSVKNISKVTGALEAVSASRVQKAQAQTFASRAYAKAAQDIMVDIARHQDGSITHPLLEKRAEIKHVGVVLITSDRGLAGPYNTNIIREAIDKHGGHATIFKNSEENDLVFHPVSGKLHELHMNVKLAMDPHCLFNPYRMYEGF